MLRRTMPTRMPKHIFRLIGLLGGFLLLGLTAKACLTDPSFYEFGHYRADAVPELAAGTPLFRGAAYCQTCHTDSNAVWSIGAHRTVQCEVCHGADREHPDDGKTLTPVDTIRLCTTCHEAITGRPARQPQIVLGEHPFPDEKTEQCHTCHDPHSPGDMEPDAAPPNGQIQDASTSGASIDPPALASKCAKCHGQQGQGVKKNPALAGLESAVFIERMNLYKSGAREHKMMAKFARSLSDEEQVELARYYERLTANSPE